MRRVTYGDATSGDDELVRAALDDDVAAFEELVRRHRDAAYRVALRICRDRADAEDVTQEAIVRAWRSLDGFRGDARFSTWLYRIVTNLALNRVTRRRERPTDAIAEGASSSTDPAARTVDAERFDQAVRALDQLTAEQRACFVLCEIEGLSYEEAAHVLGVGVPAVKGRLFRARQDLGAHLARYDASGG